LTVLIWRDGLPEARFKTVLDDGTVVIDDGHCRYC
jgi:hypothetical protein